MNVNTAPGAVNRNAVNVTPGYMSGFGNSFETEALAGALPIGRNSPQRYASKGLLRCGGGAPGVLRCGPIIILLGPAKVDLNC